MRPSLFGWNFPERVKAHLPSGRYDNSFITPGADGYKRDLPGAELHVLDAGHFALDEKVDEIAALMLVFLDKHLGARTH